MRARPNGEACRKGAWEALEKSGLMSVVGCTGVTGAVVACVGGTVCVGTRGVVQVVAPGMAEVAVECEGFV